MGPRWREIAATGALVLAVVALWSVWVFQRSALPAPGPGQAVERIDDPSGPGWCPRDVRGDADHVRVDAPEANLSI